MKKIFSFLPGSRRYLFTFLMVWVGFTLFITFCLHRSVFTLSSVQLDFFPKVTVHSLGEENTQEKFLLFIPAFGPNNQYRGMKEGMVAARLLNRTFVLPVFVQHNTMGKDGYRPFNATFQEKPIRNFVPTISMEEFSEKSNQTIDILVWMRRNNPYWTKDLRNYLELTNLTVRKEMDPKYFAWNSRLPDDANEKVYFSTLDSFPRYFFKELGIDQNVRTIAMAFPFRNLEGELNGLVLETATVIERAQPIQTLAKQAWLQIGTTKEKLLAVHWRHGEQTCRKEPNQYHEGYDFCFGTSAYFWTHLSDFITALSDELIKKRLTHIYLATDSVDQVLYEKMKAVLPIRRASDVPVLTEITDNYYLSLVEQEICTRAKFFVGAPQTTWSEYIINYWDAKHTFKGVVGGTPDVGEGPPAILTIDTLLESRGIRLLRHNYWGWILKNPALPPKECIWEGVDYSGSDLAIKTADDPVDCYNECLANVECQCWTHVYTSRSCYIKGPECPKAVTDSGIQYVSGTRSCPYKKTPDGCFWEDMDYMGNDIRYTPAVLSAEACFKICQANPSCQCWSYTNKTSTCWEKDPCPLAVNGLGVVSGKRICEAEVPDLD